MTSIEHLRKKRCLSISSGNEEWKEQSLTHPRSSMNNCSPENLPNRLENLHLHKNWRANHSRFFPNHPKRKSNQESFQKAGAASGNGCVCMTFCKRQD